MAALSRILFARGEFELAQRYAAQGSALYDPRQHSPYIPHVAHDPDVNCLATQVRSSLTTTGAKMGLTGLSCELAWAYGKAGRAAEGLPLLAEALVVVDNTGEYFALAELYRRKGQLTLKQSQVSSPTSLTPST